MLLMGQYHENCELGGALLYDLEVMSLFLMPCARFSRCRAVILVEYYCISLGTSGITLTPEFIYIILFLIV